ncbi:refilin-A isoform X2 [Kogia breviceps]|uniref:refilin-A isoform X2 n=1 Tax=Kogia breviceps TaxID=27615 RepID=UPI0034D31BB7
MLMPGPRGPADHTLRAADLHDDLEHEVTTCVRETELSVWREKQNRHQPLRRSPKRPLPLPPSTPAREMRPRMLPVFFGESIEVNPEPTPEIRCNSEVKYASEKHFRDKVFYAPVPTVTAYSETIVAAPNCTWRSYRSQLTLEPRPRALRFRSTTIIFPKRARSSFRTTLHLSLGRPRRWFTASVQLQLCPRPGPGLLGPAPL